MEATTTDRIRVRCPHCGAVFRVKKELAGKSGPCGKCLKTFTIAPETILPIEKPEQKPTKPSGGGGADPEKPPGGAGEAQKPSGPRWQPPVHDGSPITGPLLVAAGCHFQMVSQGWQRFSLEEEQEGHREALARNAQGVVVECATMAWKLDFDDLFAGVHEFYRKATPHFRLLGKGRTTAGGLPAIAVEYEGIPKGATCQLRYMALAVLSGQSCVHVIVGGPETDAEAVRKDFAGVAASFSLTPLPPDRAAAALQPSAQRLAPKKPVVQETAKPAKPHGKHIEGAEFMAALLLRGTLLGMVIGLPVALVFTALVRELFGLDPAQAWTLRLWVFFLGTSYFGALAIGLVLNRRIQKAHGPKMKGSVDKYIGKLLGLFIGIGLLGVQETAKVFFRLLGMLFRGGTSANREAFVTLLIAGGLYGSLAGVVLIRTALRWNAAPMSRAEIEYGPAGILNEQGQQAHDQKRYADAAKLLTEAIAEKPDWDMPYIRRGWAYVELGELDKAIADHGKAIELSGGRNHEAFFGRAYAQAEKGQADRALADYTKAIELSPGSPGAYNNRGNLYRDRSEYDLALADYTAAAKLGRNPLYYRNRGWEHLRRWMLPQALSDMEEAVRLGPREANAFVGRAAVRLAMGQADNALTDCGTAIGLDPKSSGGYVQRGRTHLRTGRFDSAVADLTKAIELAPSAPGARGVRALAWFNQGKYDEAAAEADKCVELGPKSADAYCSRAVIRRLMLDLPAAAANYSKAIELSPKHAMAFAGRSRVFTDLGDEAKAMEDAETAVKLCSLQPLACQARALAHCARGAYDKAMQDASKAVELDPRDASSLSVRAMAASGKGDKAAAAADCDKAIAMEPWESFHHMARAGVCLAANDATRAIAEASKALELNRYEAWALYYRGMAHARAGNKSSAMADLSALQKLDSHGRAGREAAKQLQQMQAGDSAR